MIDNRSLSLATYCHPQGKGGMLDMRLSEVFWLVAFNLLLFAVPIQNATGFTYIDEIMTLYLVSAATFKTISQRDGKIILETSARIGIALAGITVCVGLIGNAIYGIQPHLAAILIDLFTCVKFPIALLSACVIFVDTGQRLLKLIQIEAKVVLLILLVLGIANLLFDFGMGGDPRYGLRASFEGIFGHPTYLVFACVGLSVLLLSNWKNNIPWIVVAAVVSALSLRSKGIVYAALIIVLMVLFAKRNRLTLFHIMLCLLIALFLAYDQFETYFQTDGYARTELLEASIRLASDLTPFGAGFATFGSAATADPIYYSSLYYQYGLSSVHGLTPLNPAYLSDTFWPTVLGQFNWIGLLAYLGMLIALFIFVYNVNPNARLASVCCFLYLLISSTAESAFFNPQAVYLAVCLAFALSGSFSNQQLRRFRVV